MTTTRRLAADDRAAWNPLWDAYCAFYRAEVEPAVTDRTYGRLCAGDDGVGLVAVDDAGRIVGFANLLFHESTWSARGYCYLEDLYVAPGQRGTGVAKRLIEHVYAVADARGAERVYWHTQEYNAPARSLYDTVARRTSFVVYRR
jgi:GNAT superfamily N-acetyltransferase